MKLLHKGVHVEPHLVLQELVLKSLLLDVPALKHCFVLAV